MNAVTLLRQIRGFCFALGFVLSKIKYIPFTLISPIFHLISLGFYLTGHLLSFIGSLIEPEHIKKEQEWYGFLQFKEQYRLAAIIGICATLLSIAAFYLSWLIIPAAWLFLVGNIIKTIGEYHKSHNPPANDDTYSQSQQESLVPLSISTSLLSLVGALSTTFVFIFPAVSILILIGSTIVGAGLGILAAKFWLDSYFGDHRPLPIIQSYFRVLGSLETSPSPKVSNSPKPYHGPGLFSPEEPMVDEDPTPRLTKNTGAFEVVM